MHLTQNQIPRSVPKQPQVWDGLESAKIASACIQAHRIAKRVIDAGGVMNFLVSVDPLMSAFGRIFIQRKRVWLGVMGSKFLLLGQYM